ncbi:MAG: ATP-binding cassette domain-containing protein, partial [Gammaproteobacteria bacterium]
PRGAVAVERVVVAPAADRPAVLKGVSFDVAAGECVAVIGPSAAGKSTLLRALLGLWRPQSGCVRLDGADVADWPRESLAPHVGYLPQDVELLAGTVAENIARMGPMPQSSQAVVAAATLAGAHEMILKLPGGYDTEIGDAATVLSGGQRQRIGLARALFGPPKLVVLDEPNSNLDTDGEAALVAAIRALKAMGSTVVFVTHKPSLLADADRVLVLHAGSVAAFGPRDEVLAKVAGRPLRDAQPASAA